MVGRPVLTSTPAYEPISLTLVKQFLQIDSGNTTQDSYLQMLISVVRETAEQYVTRGYVTQTYREYYDGFPGHHFPLALIDGLDGDPSALAGMWPGSHGRRLRRHHHFELSRSPLVALAQIQYLDPTGTLQTLAPSQYVVNNRQDPAQVTRAPESLGGLPWPIALREVNSVWIDYTVGYDLSIAIGMTAASGAITGFSFRATDVGSALLVPGAGAAGAALVTSIASVDSSGNGTAADNAVTAVTGAAAALSRIPYGDKQAMLLLLSHWYENRLPIVPGAQGELPYAASYLLMKNRVFYQP